MSITRLIIPPALCIFCFLTTAQTVERLSSPDEKITIDFLLQDGRPSYRVTYNSQELIHPSSLGFRFKNAASLTDGFTILETKQETVDEAWKPVWGTVNQIRNHYNQLSVKLQEEAAPQRQLHLHFRAYNDGVAFRYGLPVQPNLSDFEITSEETFFHFNADHSTWWVRNDYDSYEHLYKNTPLSEVESVNTPFTLKTEDGLSISIHEANLTDYAGMTLEPVEGLDYGLKAVLVPWPDGVKVKAVAPHQSPWRTIQIANKPGDLIESHLIQNLNEPCAIKDVSWIKPMIYMGIWWGMHIDKYTWHAGEKHGATTENAIRYIDFASKHGIPALLIEGWNLGWESWLQDTVKFDFLNSYPDFDLEKVVSYGREKSVYIIGHHETGGNVPDYELQMDSAFALYARLGIPAVKTGYAGKIIPEGQHHHGQWMVNHYRKVVELAAKYRITIDAHEPIKPTGISRTYPNMMTREGVRGMEYNAWSDGNPPEHTTIIPFTRMLAGPLDYTPGIFDLTFDEYKKENRVYSTLANQLALYVILYSPRCKWQPICRKTMSDNRHLNLLRKSRLPGMIPGYWMPKSVALLPLLVEAEPIGISAA